jgi:hypothetical protein
MRLAPRAQSQGRLFYVCALAFTRPKRAHALYPISVRASSNAGASCHLSFSPPIGYNLPLLKHLILFALISEEL